MARSEEPHVYIVPPYIGTTVPGDMDFVIKVSILIKSRFLLICWMVRRREKDTVLQIVPVFAVFTLKLSLLGLDSLIFQRMFPFPPIST